MQKPYLFTGDSWVSVGGGSKHEVVKYRGVGRDSDTAAHHHCHLELVPVLVATTEWTLDPKENGDYEFSFKKNR